MAGGVAVEPAPGVSQVGGDVSRILPCGQGPHCADAWVCDKTLPACVEVGVGDGSTGCCPPHRLVAEATLSWLRCPGHTHNTSRNLAL